MFFLSEVGFLPYDSLKVKRKVEITFGEKNKWGLMLVKVKVKKKRKRKERILDTLLLLYIREEECASHYHLVKLWYRLLIISLSLD